MFYLKYRPHTIDEIDNSPVKETVKHILQSKNLPHALLLIGQKGTGKTSTARIIAKSVNCLTNSYGTKTSATIEPCNRCTHCQSIDLSSSIDVIEMDAASNRGIDEVRNLIKETSFAPMHNRFRVFIIDEAHMITSDAFNALLKTLEEPPSSVIFILATTNVEKVPKTIRSRCFTINFGKANEKDILGMLRRIIRKEKIAIDEPLLPLIARYCEHSFRDAAKTLEELVIQKKLSFKEGSDFLGISGTKTFLETLEKQDITKTLSWIKEFSQRGGSVKIFIEELLNDLQREFMIKHKVENDSVSSSLTTKEIIVLMKKLQEAYVMLRSTPVEIIPLEIAVTEFYNEVTNQKK